MVLFCAATENISERVGVGLHRDVFEHVFGSLYSHVPTHTLFGKCVCVHAISEIRTSTSFAHKVQAIDRVCAARQRHGTHTKCTNIVKSNTLFVFDDGLGVHAYRRAGVLLCVWCLGGGFCRDT